MVCSLTSFLVVCCVDSLICSVSISESSILPASEVEQNGLSLTWSKTLRLGSNLTISVRLNNYGSHLGRLICYNST